MSNNQRSIGQRILETVRPTLIIRERIVSPETVIWSTRNLKKQLESDIFEIMGVKSIRESDIGTASTTPLLGQYSSFYGWPDDWAFYWEYLDASMFVPEVKKALEYQE